MIVVLEEVLQNRIAAAQEGHHEEIQKNSINNQLVAHMRADTKLRMPKRFLKGHVKI
jgi:hypothetical protein